MTTYFDPMQLGGLLVENRIWMSSCPALYRAAQVEELVEFYASRSSAGLIIIEVNLMNYDEIGLWRQVTDAIHVEGGSAFCRIRQSNHERPSVDRMLKRYCALTQCSLDVGFDGVELDVSFGTTIETASSELREVQLINEVLAGVSQLLGRSLPQARLGMRLSPPSHLAGEASLACLAENAANLGIGYLHLTGIEIESHSWDETLPALREGFSGPIIANGQISVPFGTELLALGLVQAIAFDQSFLTFPDLVARIAKGQGTETLGHVPLH